MTTDIQIRANSLYPEPPNPEKVYVTTKERAKQREAYIQGATEEREQVTMRFAEWVGEYAKWHDVVQKWSHNLQYFTTSELIQIFIDQNKTNSKDENDLLR